MTESRVAFMELVPQRMLHMPCSGLLPCAWDFDSWAYRTESDRVYVANLKRILDNLRGSGGSPLGADDGRGERDISGRSFPVARTGARNRDAQQAEVRASDAKLHGGILSLMNGMK